MTPTSKPAALYLRISDDREGEGLGVARQEKDCRELAARLGFEVGELYIDNDISASGNKVRPDYQRLLVDVAAGKWQAVLVWHTDRLHRRPVELEEWIRVAGDTPVHPVQAGVLDLTTPSGRMVARTLGAMASYEVEQKSLRQISKAKELAERGIRSGGGHRPYGYEETKPDGEKGRVKLVIDPVEAAVIREAAAQILAGMPLRRVAVNLNDRAILTSKGHKWSATTLKRMLCSGLISGQREYQPRTNKRTSRKLVGDIVAPAVTGDRSWPAIITPAETDALRAVLMDPSRRLTPALPRRWLLTGILRCSLCGAGLSARPNGGEHDVDSAGVRVCPRHCTKHPGTVRYVCASTEANYRCGGTYIHAEPTDEHVVGLVLAALDKDALSGRVAVPASTDVLTLEKQQEELNARLLEVSTMLGNGDIAMNEFRAARQPIADALAAIKSELNALRAPRARKIEDRDYRAEWYATDASGKPIMDLDEKRALILRVVSHVIVKPGRRGYNKFDPSRIDIHWIN